MPLNDWKDVTEARKAADEAAARAAEEYAQDNRHASLLQELEAFRAELRALGVTISYAIDEAIRAR